MISYENRCSLSRFLQAIEVQNQRLYQKLPLEEAKNSWHNIQLQSPIGVSGRPNQRLDKVAYAY